MHPSLHNFADERGLTLEAIDAECICGYRAHRHCGCNQRQWQYQRGIAGSVALNLIAASAVAIVHPGASLTGLNNQAVTVRSENRTNSRAKTKPKTGTSGDVGIGASLALNRMNNTSVATIADTAIASGTASSLTITATGAHTINTKQKTEPQVV